MSHITNQSSLFKLIPFELHCVIFDFLSLKELLACRELDKESKKGVDRYVMKLLQKLGNQYRDNQTVYYGLRSAIIHISPEALNEVISWETLGKIHSIIPFQRAVTRLGELVSAKQLHQQVADQSLIILKESLTQQAPEDFASLIPITSPQEIRGWFHQPENQVALNKITQLNLMNKNLLIIPLEVQYLPHLNSLNLKGNKIQFIPDEAFKNLTRLKWMYLENNQIQYISETAFLGLRAIEIINLAHNQLQVVSEKTFQGLEMIIVIDLENNQLQDIPKRICQGLTQLIKIDLKNNPMKNISKETFEELSSRTNVQLDQLLI